MLILPPSDATFIEALSILRSGGVVAHATETCYGFACDLANESAVRKLFACKKRSEDQPVSALFESVKEAKRYAIWNEQADVLATESLPGPLTLILPLRPDAPKKIFPTPTVQSPVPTLGVRVSSHPIANRLAQSFGSPISTTSANIHGKSNPYSAEEIRSQFLNEATQPDLIIDSGVLPPTPPSKVVDLTRGGEILRI